MGIEVDRHQGPPGESEIITLMRAEGLPPHGWVMPRATPMAGTSTAMKRCYALSGMCGRPHASSVDVAEGRQ